MTFGVSSRTPYPYRTCSCRRCRKTSGSIGAAVNVVADASTLEVTGSPTRYEHAVEPVVLSFCGRCGSALFLEIPAFPQWVYPFASAVDTPLPTPPEFVHVRTDERPAWTPAIGSTGDPQFETNTDESMVGWHERLGLETPD
ncbi:MAG TPA: GFA family protein [Actinomycetota bacterium]